MRAAWLMLTTFASMLVGLGLVGFENEEARLIAARALIFLCFAVGLWHAHRVHRPLYVPQSVAPSAEQIRLKAWSIRSGLIALLLVPALMAELLPSWPTRAFNFEYLLVLPLLLLIVPHYVRWAESRMPQPDDAYFRFGLTLTRQVPWHWREHRPLLLAWAVKIIFIPLMYSWLVIAVEDMLEFEWTLDPGRLVVGLFDFGLCIDLLLASGGYFFASRLLGNDIRSTDPSWLGWLSCVVCYPPLNGILHAVKQQVDGVIWTDWLLPSEPLYWLWAALITGSWMVYWLATASFGLKFSNLSWRGLVDCGPYRYTKHPAYLAKNIYWWLHTVPFVGVANNLDVLRNLLGLTFVSLVYYLRARTEERHLMAFPEYADYAVRVEQNGMVARVVRLCRLKPT